MTYIVDRKQPFSLHCRGRRGLGSSACVTLAALGLFAAMPANAADPVAIPLGFKYSVDKDGKELDKIGRLTIDIRVNGAAPRTFMFDTGSSALVGQVTGWNPELEQSVTTYGDGTYGNLVQWISPGKIEYTTSEGAVNSFGGQPVVRNSLTRVVLEHSDAYNQLVQTCTATPDQCDLADKPIFEDKILDENNAETTRRWWAVKSSFNAVLEGKPAEEDGTYGTFGAGNFLSKDDRYTAIGASTTSGYVISANANQKKGTTPTPGCVPCVTLNLDASIRAQFDTLIPWKVTHTDDDFAVFPGSGANASTQYEGSYHYVITFVDEATKEEKTATLSGPALLDTGTDTEILFTQSGALAHLKEQGLDISENSDKVVKSVAITGADGTTVTLNGATLSRLGDEGHGDGLVIGLPFFLQTSVMYDLQNKVTGYTNYFVSAEDFVTTAGGDGIHLSRITPEMGNSYVGSDNKAYGSIGLAGTISGAGDLSIASGADVRMTGINSYTGATLIEQGGSLSLAGPGSLAQSSRIVVNGEFSIERHGAFNPLWGVEGDDNKASIRSLAGSGHVALLDQRLVLTAAADDFTGTITDLDATNKSASGGLTIAGGTQTLSGANSFTGSTEIAAGAKLLLRATGSLAGPVNVAGVFGADGVVGAATLVNTGGTLAGSGRLASLTVGSGGTLAPGSLLSPANGIATLTIGGNLVQQAGSVYAVDVSDNANDAVAVGGTAVIEAGARLAFVSDPDLAIGQSYTVLTAAGGVSGKYDLALARVSAFVAPTQMVTANSVSVSAIQDRALAAAALTMNQIAVATAVDTLSLNQKVRDELLYLDSDAEARSAFDSLSGESIASIRGVLLDDSAYLSRGILRRATGGIDSAELTEGSSTVMWMEGETRHMSVDSDGDFSAVRLRTNGLRLGIDHRFGDFSVGAAFGHGWSKFHTTDRANEADAKGLHLGLYGLADFEGTKLAAGWTWSRYKVTGDRVADYGSISEALDSRWTGKANRLFAEVSRAFGKPKLQLEPFMGLSYTSFIAESFAETGGEAALDVARDKLNLTTIRLGARGNATLDRALIKAGLAWEQNSGARTSRIEAAFDAGGNGFVATGMTLPRHLASVELGIGFAPVKNGWLGIDYGGRFASEFQDHRGRLSFDYRF